MFCTKCGKKLDDKDSFCTNCGQSRDINNNVNTMQANNIQKKDSPSGVVIAALIIGIISIVLSFLIGPLVIPLSIVGLLLGIINKDKGAVKITSIILNCISAVIGIFILIFFGSFLLMSLFALNKVTDELDNDIPVSGFWDCKSFDGETPSDDYILTFDLDNDYDFIVYKYDDIDNNYASGKYTYKDLHKTSQTGDLKYYSIKLKSEELVENGIDNPKQFSSEFEIGINEENDEAVFVNTETYNMYYCYK